MPEMDGLEATALLREREKRTGTRLPIVAVTAHAMKGDRELCLETGMDDYISKPLRAQHLIGVIEALAGSNREPSETAGGDHGASPACVAAPNGS